MADTATIRGLKGHDKGEKLRVMGLMTKHPDDCWCIKCCPEPGQEAICENIILVKTIQSLMTVVNHNLGKLNENTKYLSCHRNPLVLKALEEIDVFQQTTLNDLQKAFK